MADELTDQPEGLDLDLISASLRADSSDVRVLVQVLADQLSGALGSRLVVERTKGLFKKSGELRAIRIALAVDEFESVIDGAQLTCTIGHTSGGIRIRSDKVTMDIWLQRLLAALNDEAAHSQQVRLALEQMVIGGTT